MIFELQIKETTVTAKENLPENWPFLDDSNVFIKKNCIVYATQCMLLEFSLSDVEALCFSILREAERKKERVQRI